MSDFITIRHVLINFQSSKTNDISSLDMVGILDIISY
jgi:hypothetical protein